MLPLLAFQVFQFSFNCQNWSAYICFTRYTPLHMHASYYRKAGSLVIRGILVMFVSIKATDNDVIPQSLILHIMFGKVCRLMILWLHQACKGFLRGFALEANATSQPVPSHSCSRSYQTNFITEVFVTTYKNQPEHKKLYFSGKFSIFS